MTRERVLVTLPNEALTVVVPAPMPSTVNPAVLAPEGMLTVEGVARMLVSVLEIVMGTVVEGALSSVAVSTSDSPTKIDCAEAVRLNRLMVEVGGGGGPGGGGGGGGVRLTTAMVDVSAVPSHACSVFGSTVKSMVSPELTVAVIE